MVQRGPEVPVTEEHVGHLQLSELVMQLCVKVCQKVIHSPYGEETG